MTKILEDKTSELIRGPRVPEYRAHVIYITGSGLDYVKLPVPVHIRTHVEAAEWAQRRYERMQDYLSQFTGFRVEWF